VPALIGGGFPKIRSRGGHFPIDRLLRYSAQKACVSTCRRAVFCGYSAHAMIRPASSSRSPWKPAYFMRRSIDRRNDAPLMRFLFPTAFSAASRWGGFADPPLSRFDLFRPGRQSIMKSIAPGDGPCGFSVARQPALLSRHARHSRMSSHSDNAHGIQPFAVLFPSSGAGWFPTGLDPPAVGFAFASINFRRGEYRRV